MTLDDPRQRVLNFLQRRPGSSIYAIDRAVDVASFPDGVTLPKLLNELQTSGEIYTTAGEKQALYYLTPTSQ